MNGLGQYFKSVKNIAASSQDKWLVYFLICIAIVLFVYLVKDDKSGFWFGQEFGWDARVTCAGVQAHADGLNPYYQKNLKGTHLIYIYLPVILDIFRPICSDGFLTHHFRSIYLALAALSAFLLCPFSFSGQRLRDAVPKTLYVFGAFFGFQWTFRTGNIAIFSGLVTSLALYLFYHGLSLQEKNARDPRSGLFYAFGAVVLGLGMSIKIVFFPLLVSLYFFPVTRPRKIILLVVAGAFFIIPVFVSFLFYHDLFFSWLDANSGRIPGQFTALTEICNPSLFCMGQALAARFGFIHYKLVGGLLYALAIALILAPLAFSMVWLVKREFADNNKSFLEKLDQFLIDNSRFAMRVATLTMLALYLCAFRLKEYAFFELAIYAAMLVVDLPAKRFAAIFAATIAGPMILSVQPWPDDLRILASEPHQLIRQFSQTIAAMFCYGVLLLDLYPAFLRLKQQAPEPVAYPIENAGLPRPAR